MSTVIDLITKFKSERPEAKLGQHLYAIPQRDDEMIHSQAFYYYVGSRRRVAVDFKKEICLHLNHLKIKDIGPRKYKAFQESMTPLENLISNEYVFPFLLFINGRMIRWEYITVIVTTERYDLLIRGMDQSIFDAYFSGVIESAFVIMLPDSITYKDGGFPINNRTLFAFDNDGLLVSSGEARTVIDNYDYDVAITGADLDIPYHIISEDNRYSYFLENVFVFNNGLYVGNDDTSILSSIVKINGGDLGGGDNFHLRAFYNTSMATPSYNNISRVSFNGIKDAVMESLRYGTTPLWLDLLKVPFDITMDRNKSYEDNRMDALRNIAEYNPLFFNEYYMQQRDFMSIQVDHQWLLDHRDEDGNLRLPRRFNDGADNFLVVLVNGELYEFYRNHKYDFEYFLCPIQGIKEDDVIEIWYFMNAKNFTLDMNISEAEPYLPLDTDYYYIEGESVVYSKLSHTDYFKFDGSGDQHFPIEHRYEYDEATKKFRLRFNETFYYGKDLTLAYSNRFAYKPFVISLPDGQTEANFFKLDLGTTFNYCNEYDRYLVFFNGRRLMNDHYRLVIPCRESTPFTKFQIYMAIPMKHGDRVEVFYLPHHFNDIYQATEELNATGLITVDKDKLPCVLDKHLFSFWVNGKKIPNSDIVNFDSNKVQLIKDQETLKTLRVTLMITDKEEYDELKNLFHRTADPIWDMVIKNHHNPYELLGLDVPIFTNIEDDFFGDNVDTYAIMRELVRDWYQCNPIVDITGPFVYDYLDLDQSIILGIDPAGNTLLDVADANLENNLDVDRPYDDG